MIGLCSDHPAVYITVEDLDAAVARWKEAGGKVVHGPTVMGPMGRHPAVQDPGAAQRRAVRGGPGGMIEGRADHA